jgi:hypothetical protein
MNLPIGPLALGSVSKSQAGPRRAQTTTGGAGRKATYNTGMRPSARLAGAWSGPIWRSRIGPDWASRLDLAATPPETLIRALAEDGRRLDLHQMLGNVQRRDTEQ